jgi:hypothetical protein
MAPTKQPNASTTTVPASKAKPESTCAWGAFRGDRVAPSAHKGKVYMWNHRGAFKNFPEASLGVGLPVPEAKRLIPLLQRTIAEAEKQATEAAAVQGA